MLGEFFAVTGEPAFRALYRFGIAENGCPYAEVLDLVGFIPPERRIGTRLNDHAIYSRVALANPIIFYSPSDDVHSAEGKVEDSNPLYWRLTVAGVVGLFTELEDAKACFDVGTQILHDSRWTKATEETRAEIGSEHPVFEVCDAKQIAKIQEMFLNPRPPARVASRH